MEKNITVHGLIICKNGQASIFANRFAEVEAIVSVAKVTKPRLVYPSFSGYSWCPGITNFYWYNHGSQAMAGIDCVPSYGWYSPGAQATVGIIIISFS